MIFLKLRLIIRNNKKVSDCSIVILTHATLKIQTKPRQISKPLILNFNRLTEGKIRRDWFYS